MDKIGKLPHFISFYNLRNSGGANDLAIIWNGFVAQLHQTATKTLADFQINAFIERQN